MGAGTFTLMLALGIMTTPALAEEESLPDQIVDALNKADGAFPGYRATHAKGLVAEGNFKPTREAAELEQGEAWARPGHLKGRRKRDARRPPDRDLVFRHVTSSQPADNGVLRGEES